MTGFPRTVLLALLLAIDAIAQAVTVVPLNDTGQSLCYDSAGTVIACASGVSGAADDGRYGRDAANTAGQLGKIGAGSAGFDFSKIANNGSVLPASATLGSSPSDWACTKDNVTGLIWEVKTTIGFRYIDHIYTWYSLDSTSNGGNPGSLGTNTCASTLSAYANQCNTANYATAVNAAGLCGATNWRMPTRQELDSILDYSRFNPSIDPTFFSDTPPPSYLDPTWFWTATTSAAGSFSTPADSAWAVSFAYSMASLGGKSDAFRVRLVRTGQ